MLQNFSNMADVETANAAVKADKDRELGFMRGQPGGLKAVNKVVRASLSAAATAAKRNVSALDAFSCGEPEALLSLPDDQVKGALVAACSAGQTGAVVLLLVLRAAAVGHLSCQFAPLWVAAQNGQVDVVRLLLEARASVDLARSSDQVTPLLIAASEGHVDVVRLLLEARASVDLAKKDQMTPLWVAASEGHVDVVRLLLEATRRSTSRGHRIRRLPCLWLPRRAMSTWCGCCSRPARRSTSRGHRTMRLPCPWPPKKAMSTWFGCCSRLVRRSTSVT
jgi:hypothetical protein